MICFFFNITCHNYMEQTYSDVLVSLLQSDVVLNMPYDILYWYIYGQYGHLLSINSIGISFRLATMNRNTRYVTSLYLWISHLFQTKMGTMPKYLAYTSLSLLNCMQFMEKYNFHYHDCSNTRYFAHLTKWLQSDISITQCISTFIDSVKF